MVNEMKDFGGRSRHSGTVIKKRNSSGCLIIKKSTNSVAGDSRFSDSSSKKLLKFPKEKKRSRVVQSDSESSDSAYETIRPKVDKFHNGSVPYKGASRGLDVFEFDEYDRFDDKRIRKDVNDGRYSWNRYTPSCSTTNRFEIEDDECDLPLSAFRKKHRLSSGKSIRLQGKNGVLKVMVNNNNKHTSVSHSSYDDRARVDNLIESKRLLKRDVRDVRDKQTFIYEDGNKKKREMKSSFHSDTTRTQKRVVYKSKMKLRRKSYKNEEVVKKVSGMNGKECTIKRGTGTEKQILREKIKKILVDGGWTIDYRPRRNRDYLDSVYINPSGIGYWSIIKAYDAFLKEEESNSKDGGLRDEILGKLTRQTQKKMEREMINKRKVENDDDDDDDDDEEIPNSYGRKSRKIDRCSLLVRGYNKAENNDGFVPYSRKRTLFSWLIDSNVMNLEEQVEYMNSRKTQILQKGWITKDGIQCGCCNKIVSVLKFEEHAGSKLGHPFLNIFLESGKSLMQCQIDAWNKLGELEKTGFYSVDDDGDDPNDDTCGLCGDGGDLICCDGCPSTFHQNCLDLTMLPQGDWLCPNCSCKYCGIVCTNSTQASLTCYLCQKKYHESCNPEIDVKQIKSDYPDLSFCGHECHKLYSQLQKLVGVKHKLDSEYSWSLIHRSELSTDTSSVELSQRVACNSMLAVAMSLMEECFLPFTDRRSGINLIRNVVFNCGSNLSRLNYSGFFTAILERGDEVVCAASIRIHGTRLAEMPFIGTRHIYRRQGMCRRLLSGIETVLSSLQVEKLMIPAVPEHMDTWTDVFGFHPLEESDTRQLKSLNMLVFPRTDMLQKPLPKVKTDSGSQNNASTEIPPINSRKLSGPVGANLEFKPDVDEPELDQLPELESDSIDQHSNANLKKTDVQDAISNNIDVNCESLSLDVNITMTVTEEESTEKDLSLKP